MDQEQEEKYAILAFKYLQGTLTVHEQEELMEYLQDPLNKAHFDKLISPENLVVGLIEVEEAEASREQNVINIPGRSKPASALFIHKWRLLTSVAAVLILVYSGYFIYTHRAGTIEIPKKTSAVVHNNNDIAPGGNKAILTLSNGEKVKLKNTPDNHLLIKEGDVSISRSSNLLTYSQSQKNEKQNDVAYNNLETPRGGNFQVVLPDGTKVWLNAASSIRYPIYFSGNQRLVELRGEAYFEVINNPKMPFRVRVGDELVEDLGTHFDINAYEDEPFVKTTLVEGSIRIYIPSLVPVILKPGQQLQVESSSNSHTNYEGSKIKVVKETDIDRVMAWKNGLFSFDHTDIKAVMRELSRWYDVSVDYEGNVKSNMKLSGRIDKNLNASDVLKILEINGVHFRIEGNHKIVVMP